MTYSRVTPYPLSPLHPPHERIVNATRRLYAQAETSLLEEENERDLAWLGMLMCLAGGVLQVEFFRWLLG